MTAISGDLAPSVNIGDLICKVDPRYYRPTEVETLLGDPSSAERLLGWRPSISVQEMCAEMVREDLAAAVRNRHFSSLVS